MADRGKREPGGRLRPTGATDREEPPPTRYRAGRAGTSRSRFPPGTTARLPAGSGFALSRSTRGPGTHRNRRGDAVSDREEREPRGCRPAGALFREEAPLRRPAGRAGASCRRFPTEGGFVLFRRARGPGARRNRKGDAAPDREEREPAARHRPPRADRRPEPPPIPLPSGPRARRARTSQAQTSRRTRSALPPITLAMSASEYRCFTSQRRMFREPSTGFSSPAT